MSNINKVFLLGNLCTDPELKQTPRSSVCNLIVATNRKSGQVTETCFTTVEVWGKTAETCCHYLRKGSSVWIEGRLKQDFWNDSQTGKKMEKLKVVADNVQFMPRSRSAASDDPRPDAPEAYPEEGYYQSQYDPEPAQTPHNNVPFYGCPPTTERRGVDPADSGLL